MDVRQIVAPQPRPKSRYTEALKTMDSEGLTGPAAWYLGATPAAVARWLARLHWSTVAIDAAVVAAALVVPQTDFPLRRLGPLVAVSALAHADVAMRLARQGRVPWAIGAASLGVDVVLLTGLLELSGGPSNPFSVIYAVQIALAAITLGSSGAYLIGAWALVCYGVLISWHLEELVPAHHRLVDFPTHLFTMWLAIGTLVDLAGRFVSDASAAVSRRETELEDMRRQAARTEHLMSLTTLAAGAAHELSTPLATIAIASRELERALVSSPAQEAYASDARLIRQQVDRCQLILDQMSGRAGGSGVEVSEPVRIEGLLADIAARLDADQVARLRTGVASDLPSLVVPRTRLVQVLLSLVQNAFDATTAPQPVRLDVAVQNGMVRFTVRDEGHGMSAETLRRAGEPFYTTKEPGRGFGLGLFLARMFAERCGGSLQLVSDRGTTATLELPATARRAEVA